MRLATSRGEHAHKTALDAVSDGCGLIYIVRGVFVELPGCAGVEAHFWAEIGHRGNVVIVVVVIVVVTGAEGVVKVEGTGLGIVEGMVVGMVSVDCIGSWPEHGGTRQEAKLG